MAYERIGLKTSKKIKQNLNLDPVTGEEHGSDLDVAGKLSSGDSLVGLNITVTPTGTGGSWVSGIYAKVTQGSTKAVNGYISAAELELILGAGHNLSDHGVLVLNYTSTNAQLANCAHPAYIYLRDYSAGDKMPNLFYFADQVVGADSDTASLLSANNPTAATHCIKFQIGTTPYWLMAVNLTGLTA